MTDDRDWYDLLRRAIDEAIRLADEAEQREAYPSWREVVQAHSDRAAVLTRLFAEELVKLAQEAGRGVPDGWGESPALAVAAWTTGDGVDGDALNLAEWRAFNRYFQEYAGQLGEPAESDIERYYDLRGHHGLL